MSNPTDNLRTLARDLTSTLARVDELERHVAFLTRVIKQAVLTHGELIVDPSLSSKAETDPRDLFFGGGKVTLEDTFWGR